MPLCAPGKGVSIGTCYVSESGHGPFSWGRLIQMLAWGPRPPCLISHNWMWGGWSIPIIPVIQDGTSSLLQHPALASAPSRPLGLLGLVSGQAAALEGSEGVSGGCRTSLGRTLKLCGRIFLVHITFLAGRSAWARTSQVSRSAGLLQRRSLQPGPRAQLSRFSAPTLGGHEGAGSEGGSRC